MFDEQAIKKAEEMVKYLKSIDGVKREYGKLRLNRGRGENYGNTPVAYSIIFSVGEKYFHFFTSDMRWTRGDCRAIIRTCESPRDFTGGMNHRVESVEELRNFIEKELAK